MKSVVGFITVSLCLIISCDTERTLRERSFNLKQTSADHSYNRSNGRGISTDGTTITFDGNSVIDAHVVPAKPNGTYGNLHYLRVNQAPSQSEAFIRFDVKDLPSKIKSVRLKLYVYNLNNGTAAGASSAGIKLYSCSAAENSWHESGKQGINWKSSRGMCSTFLAQSNGVVKTNDWLIIELPVVVVNSSGLHSFKLVAKSQTKIYIRSHNYKIDPKLTPKLEFVLSNGPNSTPSTSSIENPEPTRALTAREQCYIEHHCGDVKDACEDSCEREARRRYNLCIDDLQTQNVGFANQECYPDRKRYEDFCVADECWPDENQCAAPCDALPDE